jgi:hypothetical protein
MWKRHHVKYLFMVGFNETWILGTDFQKKKALKFHQNPSSGSRVVPCGWTDGHDEANTVEPLITDTAGEFKFCPL